MKNPGNKISQPSKNKWENVASKKINFIGDSVFGFTSTLIHRFVKGKYVK